MVSSDTLLFCCRRLQLVFSSIPADCQQSRTKQSV